MKSTFVRDRYTWMLYLLLAFYVYFLNGLGPITPFLKEELNLSYTVSSLHYSMFALGILLVGVGGSLAIRRLGRWRSLWLGTGAISVMTFFLALGRSPWVTISASFFMGLFSSLIIVIVPLALTELHGDMRAVAISEANMIASLVATSAPVLVGALARTQVGWRAALVSVAFAPLLLFPLFRSARPRDVKNEFDGSNARRKPLPWLYWLYWVCLFLGVSAEFCMISWSADYLKTTLNMTQADAALSVSLFLLAMILGRFTGSRLVQRISIRRVLPVSILLAVGGFFLYWANFSILLTLFGLFLAGLGIANLYPLGITLALGAAGDELVQGSTRASLASGLAILVLPLVLGRLADAIGIHAAYMVVPVVLLASLLLLMLGEKMNRQAV